MKIAGLSLAELARRLDSPHGFVLETGPFRVRIHTRAVRLAPYLQLLYREYPLLPEDDLTDFRIALRRKLRFFIRPQVILEHDGLRWFEPFPLALAPPLFEWGLNFYIATSAHQYLMLHAAVLEREGRALILAARPGLGKSTLCAALMLKGWRLLSDEFGLVRADGALDPIPRPIPLKNQSIEVICASFSEAVLGPSFHKTRKGTVAHLRPTPVSVERMAEPAVPAWIVFPCFSPGAQLALEPVPPAYAFLKLASNAFNYEVLGGEGFKRVARLIRQCQRYNFIYGRLDQALEVLDSLLDR